MWNLPFDIPLVPSIAFVLQEKRSSAFPKMLELERISLKSSAWLKGHFGASCQGSRTSNDSERIELYIKLKDLERNICLYSHIYIYIRNYIYITIYNPYMAHLYIPMSHFLNKLNTKYGWHGWYERWLVDIPLAPPRNSSGGRVGNSSCGFSGFSSPWRRCG